MATIVQAAGNISQSGGGTIVLPSPVTIGNTLVYMCCERQATPPAPSGPGAGAWSDLVGQAVSTLFDGGGNASGLIAFAKVADSTSQTFGLGLFHQAVVWELANAPLATLSPVVFKSQQAGSSCDIGGLGKAAAAQRALLMMASGADLTALTVTPAPFARRQFSCRDSIFGSDSGNGAFPNVWIGDAAGAGAALEALVTLNGSHQWAGIAVLAGAASQPAFTGEPGGGMW